MSVLIRYLNLYVLSCSKVDCPMPSPLLKAGTIIRRNSFHWVFPTVLLSMVHRKNCAGNVVLMRKEY